MEELDLDNIPDENIQIYCPKKCDFLLRNSNMFIKSEKKKNKIIENFLHKEVNKEKNESDDSKDLETIVNDTLILTNSLMDEMSNSNVKKIINDKNINIQSEKKTIENISIVKSQKNINNLNKNKEVSFNKRVSFNKKNSILNINKNNPNIYINNTFENIKRNSLKKNKNNCIIKNNYETYLTQSLKIKKKNNFLKSNKLSKEYFYSNYQCGKSFNYNNNNNKNNLYFERLNKKEINSMPYKRKKIPEILPNKNSDKSNPFKTNKNMKEKRILIPQKELNPYINKTYEQNNTNDKIDIKTNSIKQKSKYKIKLENKIKFSKEKDISKNNTINTTNSKNSLNFIEQRNNFKKKIFLKDYCLNRKKDFINLMNGLNIIKEIFDKKINAVFLRLKKLYIQEKKKINNKILINKNLKKKKIIKNDKNIDSMNCIFEKNKNIYIYYTNKKDNNKIIKNYTLFQKSKKNNNSQEINQIKGITMNFVNNKNKNNNNFLPLNQNIYINNCNINNIQINLYNNECLNRTLSSKNEIKKKKILNKSPTNKYNYVRRPKILLNDNL